MNRRVMAAAVSLALAACGGGGGGGGGSPTSLVGTFRRTGRGVEFESASGKGITDSGGNFIYRDGETVSFRIGALALGAAKPQDRRVSPLELVGTANTSDARVIRMLRTLQSLDSDGDPENGIQISEAVRQTLARHDRLDLTSAATTDLQVTALIGEYKVSGERGPEHFERHRGDHSGEDDDYTRHLPTRVALPAAMRWSPGTISACTAPMARTSLSSRSCRPTTTSTPT